MRLKGGFSAKVTALALKANAVASALKSVVIAQALKAEVILGFFIRIILFADTANTSDNDTLDVTKNVSDAGAGSDDDTLDFVKNTQDATALSDDDTLAIAKNLTEQPGAAEAHAFDVTKLFSNAGSVAEDATLTPGKVFTDSSAFTDNDTLDVTKDVGGDTAQDYCDVTYFLEDYTVGDRLDRIFLGDEEQLTYVKNLSDQTFVTDDLDGEATTEDDQEIDFVKTRSEIVSIGDVFDRDVAYSRAFAEAPAANDSPAVGVTKPTSDSGTVSDTFAKTVVYIRDFTESPSTSDSDTITFGAVKSDDGALTDSDVKSMSKSLTEAPSAASSGTLRSQGYCDFTYFAEDYVGASRTFT